MPCNGIVDDGGRLARDIGLKILRDALEASETGFRQLGFLMLHRDRYLTERQRPAQLHSRSGQDQVTTLS
jgi:hypothetical protein